MNYRDLALPPRTGGRLSIQSRLRGAVGSDLSAALTLPGGIGLAVLAGAAYAASFPPLSSAILAWVALAPLLVACAALSPLYAAIAGACWALAAITGVAWCLPGMLSGYFGLDLAASWVAALAIALLQSLYFAAYAGWVSWLVRRRTASPLLLAAGWVVCELARANAPAGAPWALTAYSQIHFAPLVQIADVAGPYGIGFLVAAVNAGIAALFAPALRGKRPEASAAVIAALALASLLYGTWRLEQTFGEKTVRVAVVQAGAPSADRAGRAPRLARHLDLMARNTAGADLVVWPEYAVESYLEEPSRAREAVLGAMRDSRADLVLGGPHYERAAAGTRYHNSVYLVREGRVAGRYDKRLLVPFAEDGRLGGNSTPYTSGIGSSPLPARAAHVGALLCFESMFPELSRQTSREGAELLVNLSNDAWFGYAAPAQHQLEVASLRAIENRRPLVRAASTGFSAVIDAHGRVVAQSELGSREVLDAEVRLSHAVTPYQRLGDAFAWIAVAIAAVVSLRPVRNWAHKKRRTS